MKRCIGHRRQSQQPFVNATYQTARRRVVSDSIPDRPSLGTSTEPSLRHDSFIVQPRIDANVDEMLLVVPLLRMPSILSKQHDRLLCGTGHAQDTILDTNSPHRYPRLLCLEALSMPSNTKDVMAPPIVGLRKRIIP